MKSEHQLFIELTNEEASSVTGGNARAVFLDVQQIIAGSGTRLGKANQVRGLLDKYRNWSWNLGGGIILGDVKGGGIGDFRRFTYGGAKGAQPADLPNGWDWGVTRNGKALLGGFGGPKW